MSVAIRAALAATIGLIGGSSAFDSAFSVPPFQPQQLRHPGIHTVLNSYDVMGGPHTFTAAWTTRRFHDQNPAVYKALMAALEDAIASARSKRRRRRGRTCSSPKSRARREAEAPRLSPAGPASIVEAGAQAWRRTAWTPSNAAP